MQRSTISAAEICRCGMPASALHFRTRTRAPAVVVSIPPLESFLPVTAEFAKTILGEGLTDSRLFQVTIFLANAPAHVEARQITSRERPHGISEFDECLIDRRRFRAFLNQKLCFAPVWTEHSVADKTAAVPNQNSDLADLLRQLHTSSDYFPARLLSPHNLEQAHHVRRTEKMGP